MKKIIIDGGVGTGKTYKAIHMAKDLGRFIYAAPCRQLVYETLIKYGSKQDSLSTGEISLQGPGNRYCVYESLRNMKLSDYDSLIIDEAHFIQDSERGEILHWAINTFKGNIILSTATRNFRRMPGFTIIKLKALTRFRRKRIPFPDCKERLASGVPTIVFRKYKDDCGGYGGVRITSSTPPYKRLDAQLKFASGEITLIECTNVLAQGLNFPAENVLIEHNAYDTKECNLQKIGRLGRYGITDSSMR